MLKAFKWHIRLSFAFCSTCQIHLLALIGGKLVKKKQAVGHDIYKIRWRDGSRLLTQRWGGGPVSVSHSVGGVESRHCVVSCWLLGNKGTRPKHQSSSTSSTEGCNNMTPAWTHAAWCWRMSTSKAEVGGRCLTTQLKLGMAAYL